MNATLSKTQTFTWRDIEVRDLRSARARFIKKHGSMSIGAVKLRAPYMRISHAFNGREWIIWIIRLIAADLELSNHEVLMLWPLLGEWPKEDRRAA